MEEKLHRRIAWFAPWTWKRRRLLVAMGMLLLVIYPLSIGPVYYLVCEEWIPFWCSLPYGPIINTAMKYDTTKEILFAYLRWFYPHVPFD